MSDSEGGRRQRDLETLRVELGSDATPGSHAAGTPITLVVGGEELVVWIPPTARHTFRHRFRDLARREKRRAADAGNAANTSQLVGGSIGGALAASGVIALATASAPLALPAIIATGVGALVAVGGLMAGHWMNRKKFAHEELLERYSDIAEELT